MSFDNQEQKYKSSKKKKLLEKRLKKRDSLRKYSSEYSEEYKERVIDNLSPIENIFLSGKEIKSTENIIRKWQVISNSPFWKNNYLYTIIEEFFYIYLQEKYKNTKGVSIIFGRSKFLIEVIKTLKFSLKVKYNKPVSTQYKKFTTDMNFYENLNRVMEDPNINLIVIPFSARDDTGKNGHAVVFMINKYLKTIEFYDSNGSNIYSEYSKYPDYQYVIDGYYAMREWFFGLEWYKRDGYKFLEVCETNPTYGIQYYGDGPIMDRILPERFQKKGWCMIYSLMIIHYRIYYYKIEPLLLQQKLLKEVNKNASNKGSSTVEFLLNYLIYISEKINDPEFLSRMKKFYPDHFPSIFTKTYIKRHTVPYIFN